MNSVDVSAHASLDPVKFSDVEGVDEAKSDLEEIVQFLKHPKDFLDIGGRLPKGVLLHGPVYPSLIFTFCSQEPVRPCWLAL